EHHQAIDARLRRRSPWKIAVALTGIAAAAGLLLVVGPWAVQPRQNLPSGKYSVAQPSGDVASTHGETPPRDDANAVAMLTAPSESGYVKPGWKPGERFETEGIISNGARNTQMQDGSVVMNGPSQPGLAGGSNLSSRASGGMGSSALPALNQAAQTHYRHQRGLGSAPSAKPDQEANAVAFRQRSSPRSSMSGPVGSAMPGSAPIQAQDKFDSPSDETFALRGHGRAELGYAAEPDLAKQKAPAATSFNGAPARIQTRGDRQQFGLPGGMPEDNPTRAQPSANQQGKAGANQQGKPGANQQGKPAANQQGKPGASQTRTPGAQQAGQNDKRLDLLNRVDKLQAANVEKADRDKTYENQIKLMPPAQEPAPVEVPRGGEEFAQTVELPFVSTEEDRLSTFSIDVDTASYANVRRYLVQGGRPPKDAVRIEELVNYFRYDYPQPTGKVPFSVNVEIARSPWNPAHRLARIGLRGKDIDLNQRPPSNLVFLLDVSGSMAPANKLPLAKAAMKMLVERLGENDRIAVVVYAGRVGLALPSTPGSQQGEILSVIDQLQPGGSTNGGDGLRMAYEVARSNFIKGGTNRVILCTDGDFNVGPSSDAAMFQLIEHERKSKVFLSTLGFGMGNLKDSKLEGIADKGNGNYHYIDDLAEARKVLVEEMGGTLVTIAKDVKIQVEFNPGQVARFRLIGYENRIMAHQDFRNDAKDAGEIGAGHTVTALYELVPAEDAQQDQPSLTVRLRYKQPEGDVSEQEIEQPVKDDGKDYAAASPDFKFASAVAGFGLILRDSQYRGSLTLAGVKELAQAGLSKDKTGYRKQFVELVER
ncbi:MAG: von Willebrand factor type A domain-containing protein, partial [Isosphaeraceae bacterium]